MSQSKSSDLFIAVSALVLGLAGIYVGILIVTGQYWPRNSRRNRRLLALVNWFNDLFEKPRQTQLTKRQKQCLGYMSIAAALLLLYAGIGVLHELLY